MHSRIYTLWYCLATSVPWWNMFFNVKQIQRYPNHRLGLLKNPCTIHNTEKMQIKRQKWRVKIGILGNMKVLSFHCHVLTLLEYQNRYCGCVRSQPYQYGRCAILKLLFVAPKFRLRRVKKRGKKEHKMKNCVLQKKLFFFACSRVGHCFGGQYGSEKSYGEGVLAKKNFWILGTS